MKILAVGDVVSAVGREMLFRCVDELKYKENIDLCIANGENSSHGPGMTRSTYSEMSRAGVDGFTLGNHTWGSKEITPILEREDNVIRPANYSPACPGKGLMLLTAPSGKKAAVINLIGQTYMLPCNNPFEAAEELVKKAKQLTNIILVDFHAEATSEKLAMGNFLDGKVSAVFGTHTHIQTADERILPGGTGFICDLGMTGVEDSVLGMNKKIITDRFVTAMPQKFELATGKGMFNGCIFDIDEDNGLCTAVKRLYIRE